MILPSMILPVPSDHRVHGCLPSIAIQTHDRPMVHEFLFFQNGANALEFSDFFGVMENNPIRTDIEVIEAAFAQFAVELRFVAAIELLDVQNEFVQIVGIIMKFSQLD